MGINLVTLLGGGLYFQYRASDSCLMLDYVRIINFCIIIIIIIFFTGMSN